MATKPRAGTQRGGYGRFAKPAPVPAHIDPEETPPPQELPEPTRLPGSDSIPPQIMDQLVMLHGGHRALAEATTRLWAGRHDHGQIEKLRDDVHGYAQTVARHDESINKYLLPVARDLPGQLEAIGANMATLAANVEALTDSLSSFRGDIRERLGEQGDEIDALRDVTAGHTVALALIHDDNLAPRVRTLEEHHTADVAVTALTKKQKGGVALLGTAGGGIVALITKLLEGWL